MVHDFNINPKCNILNIQGTQFFSGNRLAKLARKKVGYFNFDNSPIKELNTGRIHKISSDHESVLDDCFNQQVNVEPMPEGATFDELEQETSIFEKILQFKWNLSSLEEFTTNLQQKLQSKWVRFYYLNVFFRFLYQKFF